jgi:porphobilinogen synthase
MARFPAARPRRLRATASIRALVREHVLSVDDLVWPLFVQEGDGPDVPIPSMPGQVRRSVASVVRACVGAHALGIRAVAVFPRIDDIHKSLDAAAAWDDGGLVPRVVAAIKEAAPGLLVWTDVALDPYSALGQDGLVGADGRVLNDETVAALVAQACCHARAGADFVCPSDMMDGRVGAIRRALDAAGHADVGIVAYSAKFASSFYGPFRDALDSAPRGGGDKKTYQLDPANGAEAMREIAADVDEGADIVMVKPGLAYLDVVREAARRFEVPVSVYQVSGEYAMIEAAAANGWLDRRAVVLESLLAFKRAGASMIWTYHAFTVAQWLREGA